MKCPNSEILSEDHRMLVEMSSGAPLSILTYGIIREVLPDLTPYSNVICITCGGNLITADMIHQWKSRFKNAHVTVRSGDEIFMRMPDGSDMIPASYGIKQDSRTSPSI